MEPQTISILLLGDEKVGKSTFLSRISQGGDKLQGPAAVELLRDINQPFVFEVRLGKRSYRLEFFDNSSPESWRLLQPDLLVLCYDISQRLSLINLQRVWMKEARVAFDTRDVLPVVVLGLKRDLRSEDDPNGIIYPPEGVRVAQEMRADQYIECSTVTGELLQTAFEDMCKTAMRTTTVEGGQSEGGCSMM